MEATVCQLSPNDPISPIDSELTKTVSDEEDPDEYPFPLTLRTKSGPASPLEAVQPNGN